MTIKTHSIARKLHLIKEPLRTALYASCASMVMASAAFAQDTREIDVNIESQSLASALTSFGRQTDTDIIFKPETVREINAPEIKGAMTATDALDKLLANTGLNYQRTASGVVMINNSAPLETEKQLTQNEIVSVPQPDIIADTGTTQQTVDIEGTTATVRGGLRDSRTGSNLKGALVEIEETGQTTATDDLGNFRFSPIPSGTYTLRISYLGYSEILATLEIAPGEAINQVFEMSPGAGRSEIIVYGTRSARAKALNQERVADNFTTVLTSDLLGGFNGTTISDVLRRTPGVAFEPDPVTGEGANVIVRGLAPDLNQVTLNGLRLAEGSGFGRSPDLSSILIDSIEKVTINKTLLPSHDSNGAGGLVEIETKSPLDRDRRFASFGLEHGWKGGDFGNDTLASGTISGIFGKDESFGASLSVQYRDQKNIVHGYESDVASAGLVLPAGAINQRFIDPRTLFPFEAGFEALPLVRVGTSSLESESEDISITASLQKQFGDHTNLRLDVVHSDGDSQESSSTTNFNDGTGYRLLPVPELNGEERFVFVSEDADEFFPGFFLFGSRTVRASEAESQSTSISLQGTSEKDEWTFEYGGGYVAAESGTPFDLELSIRGDANLASDPTDPFAFDTRVDVLSDEFRNRTIGGLIVSSFPFRQPDDPSFLFPGLSALGQDLFGSTESSLLSFGGVSSGASGSNDRYTVSGSANRKFSKVDWLNYIEAGFNYEESSFESIRNSPNSVFYSPPFDFNTFSSAAVPLTGFGLEFGENPLTALGVIGAPDIILPGSVSGVAAQFEALAAAGTIERFTGGVDVDMERDINTEEELSGYIQGRVDIGKLEIIGGVRVSEVKIDTNFFNDVFVTNVDGTINDAANAMSTERINASTSQTDVLPRVVVNYRPTDKMAFRAGYFTTFSRPQVDFLVDFSSISLSLQPFFGPNGNQPELRITRGNPDLKPSRTKNFDASWEWYTDSVGVIKASGFYKTTNNLLQLNAQQGTMDIIPEGVILPDTPLFNNLPANTSIVVQRNENSDSSADVWGMELSVERQLSFLPDFWRNFGVYANYTYVDSSREDQLSFNNDNNGGQEEFVIFTDQPFEGSPKHSGTAAITYSSEKIDSNLTYTAQARRRSSLASFGLHSYNEAVDTLDGRFQYAFPVKDADFRLFFEGRDLLNNSDDPFLGTTLGGENGIPKYFTGGSFLGGRQFRVGIVGNF